MEIGKRLSPIALSSLLTKQVQDYFLRIQQIQLSEAIITVFLKNSYIFLRVTNTLARTEIRMHGENIIRIVSHTIPPLESYSIRILV